MKHRTLLFGGMQLPKSFKQDTEVIHLTDSESNYSHVLKKSSATHIPGIKEKFSSALLYLEFEKDIQKIKNILTKLKKDNAKTVIVLEAKNSNLINRIPKEFLKATNVSLVVIGEIFGPVSQSEISKIFQKAIGTQNFVLKYEEEHPIAVISEIDADMELAKMGSIGGEKIVLLFYETPTTLQTAAFEMVKKFPEIELSYISKKINIPNINQEKLKKILTMHFEKKPVYANPSGTFQDRITEYSEYAESRESNLQRRKSINPHIRSIARIAVSSITVFFLTVSLTLTIALLQIHAAKNALHTSDIAKTKSALTSAEKALSLTSPLLSPLAKILPVNQNLKKLIINHDTTLDIALNTLTNLESAVRYQNIQNGQHAIAQLTYAYFSLSKYGYAQDVLGEKSSKIASILQGFPSLAEKEATYLLLFQNNSELRPTGGFIGSVGELKVGNGKIEDLSIQDVYQIDGQLKLRKEPHFIVRKHLQPHMYLRDSNFDIEFYQTAQNASQIYESVKNKKVDGVIALDFEVINRLLASTGDVILPEHNITLNEKEAQKVIQDAIQDNFFPGSTKKKDILQGLLTRLLLQIEKNPQQAALFAREVPDLLEQKHILFAFNDPSLQQLFSSNGFTGEINDMRKKKPDVIHDIFGINEANIGVNKANNTLTRRVEYKKYLGKNSLVSKAVANFFNTGTDAEEYKVYLRFITNKESKIESIEIDGVEQQIIPAVTDPQIYESQNYSTAIGLEVDEREYDMYKTIGFITTVPSGTTQEVSLIYTNSAVQNEIAKYSMLYIKQPGTTEYPLHVGIEFNAQYDASSNTFDITKGRAMVKDVINADKEYEINFSK